MKRNRIKISCLNCTKEREVTPSVIRKGHGKFCSVPCSSLWKWKQPHYKEHMSLAHKGCKPTNLKWLTENARTEKHKELLRRVHKGKPSWNKGKKCPQFSGSNHYAWIEDRTLAQEKHRIRDTAEWKKWRSTVFARDKFTCMDCGVPGGYLEAHHIIPVRSDWSKLFDINNGITLCRPCHIKTMFKEEQFAERYSAILTKV